MSHALVLLLGGALFMATWTLFGMTGIAILGAVLFALELAHDLRLYRRERSDGVGE